MHFFRNLPIGRKLTLIIMVLSGVALLLAGTTLAIYEQVSLRRTMERDFAILTDIFDDNVASGLAFNDAVSIGQTLKTLQPHQRIVAAGVYDRSGVLVAHYRRSGAADGFVFPTDRLTGQRIEGKRLDTFKDVVLAGEKIGVVYISAGLDELRERAWLHAGLVGGLLIACSLVTLFLTARVHRVISGPIEALAHTMATVTAEKNFTLRAQKQSEDELGRLIDGFNEMLCQIQTRDTALQQAHDELDGRVRARTLELQRAQEEAALEQARFKFIFEAVPIGISLVAVDATRTHLVNPAHERITGVPNADSNLPGVFMRASHPDDYRRQLEAVQPFIRGDVDHYTIEKRYVHPGGRHVWAVLTSRKFTDPATGLQQSITTVIDITERKESEAKLASSLSLLNATLESTADGILVVDSHGHMTTFNRKFAEMWRLPGEILATGSDEKAVAFVQAQLNDPDEFTRKVQELNTRPDADTFDVLDFKDGRVFERYSQVQRVEGVAVGRVFCFRDITERRRAEVRLAEASGLLQAMLENTPDFIYFKDRSSRFVRASKALAQRFSQAGEDLLRGKTDFDFFPTEEAQPSYADEQEIMRTGAAIVGKLEKETFPDGKVGWALTTKLPWRDSTGAVVGTFGISKDITALKVIEFRLAYERDQLRSLLESSPDTIYFKDLESRFVRVSHSKVRKTVARLPQLKDRRQPDGQEMAEEDLLNGLTDFDTFNDADARRAFEDEQEIIRTGLPIAGKLEKQTYLDGSVLWNLSNKMAWRDGEGKIIGTFGISKDITPLKEAEEKLAQMHRQLLEVSRQAGMAEVATGVLHNVGNVLNSVNVSATLVIDQIRESKATNLPKLCAMLQEHAGDLGEFLTRDPKGSRIPSYLITLAGQITAERQAVVEELGQLRKNVDHIKDIVAMQQSYAKVSGVSETVRVSELVEDALRMNASAISRHGLDVVRDYASDDPPVTVERHKVLQVLVNLIRNAKHACDDSGRADKRVIVRITRDQALIRVSVIDNGIGIPPENLTRIFAHGFTTKKDGHGFGLHSGALVARELGGSLGAHSVGHGQGATFTLELPLNPPRADPASRGGDLRAT